MPDASDTIQLSDGESIVVRPISPDDAPALVAMHARLSPVSVYRRYFRVLPELSDALVTHLTALDEPWRCALVGVDRTGRVVAVARYEGGPDDRDAELALVVDDVVQRGGLGLALLVRLCDVAHLRGLQSLVAEVLAANIGMLRLLQRLPFPTTFTRESEVVTATISVEPAIPEGARMTHALAHSSAGMGASGA